MRALSWMFGLLSLSVVGCGADDGGRGAPGPALVRVAQARDGGLTDVWTTVGEVVALEQAELAVGAQGPVARVVVREGDRVEQSALLLQVDASIALADHAAAQAAHDEAASELVRLEAALERRAQLRKGVLSDEELVNARQDAVSGRARVDARAADVRRAAAVLSRHRITAPFAGVVAARSVDEGDWLQAGVPVLTLVSTDRVEVRAQLPRSIAGRLQVGSPVALGSGQGSVLAVVPTLDAQTRTSLVRIAPEADTQVVAGQALDISVPVSFDEPGVTVPRDALIADPEQARLVRVVDGKAEMLSVEVLATTATEALITGEGLAAGDTVVVRGNERVRPGQEVRVEEEGG